MEKFRIIQINDSQDYDFLFDQDNKLDTQDENIKSALHEIKFLEINILLRWVIKIFIKKMKQLNISYVT